MPPIPVDKALTTIATAALLLGGTLAATARDTISRQEFEQAAHELELAAEKDKISKQTARAGIEGLRRAMGEEDARAKWEAYEKKQVR